MTPTTDALAEVLAKIAEIEEAPDYMGPRTNRIIKEAQFILGLADGIEYECDKYGHRENTSVPEDWIEDIIVGAIGRACEARSRPMREKWQYYMKWPKAPEGDYQTIVQAGPRRFEGRGDSLALAAARAYRDAIGGGDQG